MLIAASGGLGLAVAEAFLKKGWHWWGAGRAKLHEVAETLTERMEIETVAICEQAQVTRAEEARGLSR